MREGDLVSLSDNEILVDGKTTSGWWLVAEDADALGSSRVMAGPFLTQTDARWAAPLPAGDPAALQTIYGTRRGGTLTGQTSPTDQAWLDHLNTQLERLATGWDTDLDDTDPLLTHIVEVAAALTDAGLPLHDCAGATPLGGVCLTPVPELGGIVIAWSQHERMSIDSARGAHAHAAVQALMSDTIAGLLTALGFPVEPFGEAGTAHLVNHRTG